ncbi:MAG: TonB-dependent receptor [Bacteroidetes bacterium]|nr:TonB-dependent receptor [Bacteroidota bacterium]
MRKTLTHINIIALFLFLSSSLIAQPGQRGSRNGQSGELFKIVGKVSDQSGENQLEYATVTLLKANDSSAVTGAVTDTQGAFELKAPAGDYILKVGFLGFQSQMIDGIALNKDNPVFELPNIRLESQETTLDEVEIRAEKSRMEFALDKKIFNVGADLANNGGNVSDLLDNIPSVTVDIEGEVSLRGNSGVRILINGKPSSFNNADGLKQLPANLIDKVEIITNPSARYEAEGSAGIINIVLKKEQRKGWNGTFDLSTGYPHRHNASVSLNHRREKINFFASAGARYRWTPRNSFEHREVYYPDSTAILDQEGLFYRGGLSGNLRFGMDFNIDEKTTLTGSVRYRKGLDKNTGQIDYLRYDRFENLGLVDIRKTLEGEDDNSFDYSLNFERKFANKDQKLTADIIYSSGGETESMDAETSFLNGEYEPLGLRSLQQRINNTELERELTLQANYEHPIGEDGKFEAGYRTGLRTIGNDYLVEEYNYELDSWGTLENLSNDFSYEEAIHALYSTFGNKISKFSYQIGLRGEYTQINTLLKNTNERNDRNYLNVFPSLFLNYEINPGNALQWNYSRRIRRPRFWDLNPFFTYANPLSIRSGNPDLDPEFAHSLELSHIKYWKKGSLSSSIYYRHTDGVISRINRLTSEGVNLMKPENLNTRDDVGAELSLNYNPFEWWDVTWSANFFRGVINAENAGFTGTTKFLSYTSRLNSRFSLANDLDIQIMVNYRGPEANPQGRRQAILFTDLGINKDILKKKATISLRITDIFNTTWYRNETFGEDFYIFSEGQWRSRRQASVSFSYRLNQNKRQGRKGGRGEGFEGGDDMDGM